MELRTTFLVLLYMFKFYANLTAAKDNFKIEYKWSQIEFDFKTDQERTESISNGTFIEGKIVPLDVQVYYPESNKAEKIVFITCPRVSDGIPVTLGKVTNKHRNGNPIIAPYPNWEWQMNPEKCKEQRIVSVYRVIIDKCKRLWVLDNGKIGDNQVCYPQLLAFHLETDSLLRRYEIPSDQYFNNSLYNSLVVESNSKNCEDTFVYNADSIGYLLLVYDFKNDKSWNISDKTFYPDPKYEIFDIDGISFSYKDGILGLALSPFEANRKLFYHGMSSDSEHWVYTKYLKNASLFSTEMAVPQIFHTFPKGRKTQSVAEAMDKCGNLYFGLLSDIKIAAWNIEDPYDRSNFHLVGDNQETMQFPSGVKVILDENGQEVVWIMTIALQKVEGNVLFPNETNFRILSAKVEDLMPSC